MLFVNLKTVVARINLTYKQTEQKTWPLFGKSPVIFKHFRMIVKKNVRKKKKQKQGDLDDAREITAV